MFRSFPFQAIGRLIGSVGGQVAMSVAVSIGVAGVWAAPQLLLPRIETMAPARGDWPSGDGWMSSVAADAKIAARHSAAAADFGPTRHSQGLIAPAALIMPMAAGWPQSAYGEPLPSAAAPTTRPARVATTEAAPARRVVVSVERQKSVGQTAAPTGLSAAIPEASGAAIPAPPATLLDRIVYEPAAQAAHAVSGAAGVVGSVGSWTISQASGLLPRW